jgi:uncharacterized RDD family membrane protein YckC
MSGAQESGWYYAQGDPPNTQRYWDGSQWVGNHQPVPTVVPQISDLLDQTSGLSQRQGTPAGFGTRFLAYLVDSMISAVLLVAAYFGIFVVSGLLSTSLVGAAAVVGLFAFGNQVVKQGLSGSTIGKSLVNIRLVKDETGQPPGIGGAFLRLVVSSLISGLTCGLGAVADLGWPLFDEHNKRLTDKAVKMSVVS